MAIDNRLQVFNEEGQSVDYDILASDVKFLPDGKDLPTKLAEMQDEIDQAGQGDGTVTGVKVGSDTYEPTEGVVDLSTPFSGKVDKVNGKGLSTNDYTDADKTKLQNLPTATELTTQLGGKANDNAVVKSISVNGQTPAATPDQNGNVNIEVQGGLTKDDISVETQGDGTVDINVGSGANKDTYTINLNHTHEGMAKLIVCEESDLPSTLENDKIYAVKGNDEISVLWVGGLPFFGGGGPTSSPVLRRPVDDSTIDMGMTENDSASKTINVKGKSLTQALTIGITGTGFTFGSTQPTGVTRDSSTQLTVTAAAANDINGVDIVVVYSGSDTEAGLLAISSLDNISVECNLIVNAISGVKFTGSQWLQTSYKPNADTEFEMRCHFIPNANTTLNDGKNSLGWIFSCGRKSGNYFDLYSPNAGASTPGSPYSLLFKNGDDSNTNQKIIDLGSTKMTYDPVVVRLTKGSSSGTFSVESTETDSENIPNKTGSNTDSLYIGKYVTSDQSVLTYARYDLVIYEFIITENGVDKLHLVPKMHNGEACLYDTVSQTYISSETSTPLAVVI